MAKKLTPLPSEYKIDISPEMFNPVYLPHLQKVYAKEVYFGGSGSGKSTFVGSKKAIQGTYIEGRNICALRQQAKDCRDSCFNEIVQALENYKLIDLWQVKEYPEPRLFNRINGNTIAFTGLDDIENIKSVKPKSGNMVEFWVEEANEIEGPHIIRELERRLRDRTHKSCITLTFNPVLKTHWLFDYIYKELAGTDALILKTTYKDNLFLPPEYGELLERYRYTDPYSYQVYTLGNWGSTGQSVFDTNKIMARLDKLKGQAVRRCEFSFDRPLANNEKVDLIVDRWRIFDHADGEVFIYAEPEEGVPYVLAFDTAGEGSDKYAGHVLNNITGEQVAVFHSPRLPDHCIKQLYALGRYYNDAMMNPEVNFDSYPLKMLQDWGYHNIYIRRSATDTRGGGYEKKYGWRTTADNRQRMLSEMVAWVAEHIDCINDVATLNEMLTFVRRTKKLNGVFWAADNGAHDDMVMSFGIALQTREQQSCEMQKKKVALQGFYLPAEIDMMYRDGRIDASEKIQLMRRYKQTVGKGREAKEKQRSRYDR